MYNFEPTITKEYVLKHISQEQIFQHYLDHSTIELFKKNYVNTLRNDNNPDCSYAYGRYGDLMFRDFALGKSYSCFDIVKEKFGINFQESLTQIAIDFKLNDGIPNINKNSSVNFSTYNCNKIRKDSKSITEIKVKKVQWNKDNSKYWKEYGFKKSTLDKFKINPISHYWINDYCFQTKQSYTYYHGFDKVHRRTILNLGVDKKYKWFKNLDDTVIQGYDLLPKNGDLLVLSKSYKDICSLYEYGIPAVSTNAEGIPFKLDKIEEFKQRFKRVLLNIDADTDLALQNSIKLSNLYSIPAIYLPEQLNKTSKDISGCRKDIGVEKTGQLIKQLFNL